ncbi:MAG: hypothetical protein V3W34_00385, partial [Phycisphaerae bacterium]
CRCSLYCFYRCCFNGVEVFGEMERSVRARDPQTVTRSDEYPRCAPVNYQYDTSLAGEKKGSGYFFSVLSGRFSLQLTKK